MRATFWLTLMLGALVAGCAVTTEGVFAAPGAPAPGAAQVSAFDYQFDEKAAVAPHDKPFGPASAPDFAGSADCSCQLHPHPAMTPNAHQ